MTQLKFMNKKKRAYLPLLYLDKADYYCYPESKKIKNTKKGVEKRYIKKGEIDCNGE